MDNGSTSPRSTSGRALPLRRSSPNSFTPWGWRSIDRSAKASASASASSGRSASWSARTLYRASGVFSNNLASASNRSIRSSRRECSGIRPSCSRSSSGSTTSAALRCQPSLFRAVRAYARDSRSRSPNNSARSLISTPSPARYSANVPVSPAMADGSASSSAGCRRSGRGRSCHTTSYSRSANPSVDDSREDLLARFRVKPDRPPRASPSGE